MFLPLREKIKLISQGQSHFEKKLFYTFTTLATITSQKVAFCYFKSLSKSSFHQRFNYIQLGIHGNIDHFLQINSYSYQTVLFLSWWKIIQWTYRWWWYFVKNHFHRRWSGYLNINQNIIQIGFALVIVILPKKQVSFEVAYPNWEMRQCTQWRDPNHIPRN